MRIRHVARGWAPSTQCARRDAWRQARYLLVCGAMPARTTGVRDGVGLHVDQCTCSQVSGLQSGGSTARRQLRSAETCLQATCSWRTADRFKVRVVEPSSGHTNATLPRSPRVSAALPSGGASADNPLAPRRLLLTRVLTGTSRARTTAIRRKSPATRRPCAVVYRAVDGASNPSCRTVGFALSMFGYSRDGRLKRLPRFRSRSR